MKPDSGTLLELGDAFPTLEFETLDHGTLSLPQGEWTVLLLYRGEW